MDTTRYFLGVLLVVSVPPAILFLLLIHPFAGFWRKLGPRTTYLVVGLLFIFLVLVLYLARARLLGPDLGTNWGLFCFGCFLYSISAWISVATRRELADRFGAEYEEYRARVPAFVPRIGSKPRE